MIPDGRQRNRNPNQVLRLGWSGVHLPRKALPILLHAVARLPDEVAVELHILGDGPETSRWQNLATRLNIEQKCRFYGWLPRNEALDVMQSMDAFAITSLQDACSTVLFEALALGLPVISHATCGFKDVLTQECGLLVSLESPAQSVNRFAQGIEKLFRDPPLYQRLSQGALQRAGELSWKQRASVVLEHYGQIVQQKRRAA
ncbi:MAG: glycosyltransferase family 4 protein [Planctomycetes bacterium]|nr:glycosyltransferase family 4 protein [Planctomycetota bacterium]